MLKKINEGMVKSDDGFFVHITGLESMRYQENNMFIDLTWAYDPKIRKTFVYISDIEEWDQPIGKSIKKQQKEKIISNITQALKLLTGDFELV